MGRSRGEMQAGKMGSILTGYAQASNEAVTGLMVITNLMLCIWCMKLFTHLNTEQ